MHSSFTQDRFVAELARLNPAQRAAVEHIEGPLMVLAGPGTGKTHLLAARIGHILQQTDTPAGSILCLTYTDAGVKAMRDRLLQWIGPTAYRVGIFTFHSFCSRVIRDNLEYFGRRELEPLSELERVQLIRDLLDSLDDDHPLRLGRHTPYFYERQLSRLFADMKAENWTSAGVSFAAIDWATNLHQKEEFQYQVNRGGHRKGDLKEAAAQAEKLRMQRLAAAAQLFPRFEEAMARMGRYDYDDMIRWVLDAFQQHEGLLRQYQERYLYLMVDEFQDTNGSQEQITRLLADYWERPNICVVGDDDQAIYEFQGARLRSMIDFYQRYDEIKLVSLRENYRSPQALLDQAADLIEHNQERIGRLIGSGGIDKRLQAALATQHEPVTQLLRYPNPDQELAGLLQQLRLWQSDGLQWGDMAVIYARHQQADTLKQLLDRAGIPYQTKRRPNVLDRLVVRQLRDILRYLQLEDQLPSSGSHLLYRILHFRCFGLAEGDMARLLLAMRKADASTGSLDLRKLQTPQDWWPDDLENPAAITTTANWLQQLQNQIHNRPLLRLVEEVINGSGLAAHSLRQDERMERMAEIRTLLAFVEQEVSRRPRLSLQQLMQTLDSMDANRIKLPLRPLQNRRSAVQLLTAHSAKGLEFEAVWLLDAVEKQWGEGRSASNRRFKLPPTLTYSGEADLLEARRRLFYVAMTRARRQLIVSHAELDGAGKRTEPVRFLQEMAAKQILELQDRSLDVQTVADFLDIQTLLAPPRIQPPVERELIDQLLSGFRLSVSSLQRWLDCPLAFFYERVLQVPTRQRPAATYGEALHEALQNYFLRVKMDAGMGRPGRDELVFLFERALASRRAWLDSAAYDDFLRQGQRELAAYFDQHQQEWTDRVWVEQLIQDVSIEGVPLVGVIDRIDQVDADFVRIIDYKTGQVSRGRHRAPTQTKPDGGPYWRQLVFYKLLFEGRERELRSVLDCRLSYLTIAPDGQQHEVVIKPSRKDEAQLIGILKKAYASIMAQQFYEGCDEEKCDWCSFVRDRQQSLPGADELNESLDDQL